MSQLIRMGMLDINRVYHYMGMGKEAYMKVFMNKKSMAGVVSAIAAVLMLFLVSPVKSNAEVNVSVGIALPPLVFPGPPSLVVIPGPNYVYYPPAVGVDIFFYHGYWYRPYRGYWYRAGGYNGPWRSIAVERVPRAVIGVPAGFRRGPVVYEHVPYRDVRNNWRSWDRDRYWEKGRYAKTESHQEEGRGERGGHGHGHESER